MRRAFQMRIEFKIAAKSRFVFSFTLFCNLYALLRSSREIISREDRKGRKEVFRAVSFLQEGFL
jgi:hypothetical protein